MNYYSSYLSQELAKGRTMEEIIEEIGEPRIVARTIIDSTDAAAEAGDYGAYETARPEMATEIVATAVMTEAGADMGTAMTAAGTDMGAAMTAVP